ncbi:MAG: hypothetical protein QOI80_3133 [Solirubrobacteraceae bacterium]|nr:hypothetical protein [Solirubrobacteraceae bacterium]
MHKHGTEPEYKAPEVSSLGSVEEMTEQLNKIGSTADQYTQVVPILVGTVTPAP